MNKLKIVLTWLALFAFAAPALALHPSWLPQPGFRQMMGVGFLPFILFAVGTLPTDRAIAYGIVEVISERC